MKTAGLSVYIEGEDRETDGLEDYAELRYTGPRFNELSKDYWQIDIDVDVFVVSKSKNSNIYTHETNIGIVTAAFTEDLGVFELGPGPDDDPLSQIGCLLLVRPPGGGITVTNFGLPKDQVRLRQASVDATYRMNIST